MSHHNQSQPERTDPTPIKDATAIPETSGGHGAMLHAAVILEMVSDAFVAFDAEMNYTYVNARGAALLGRTPEELIGKNYWQEYPEATGTPFAAAYRQALETQSSLRFEEYYEPWGRWFENRIYPSKEGLAVFFTDITERKEAEAMVKRERDFSNALLDSLPGVFYFYDENLRFLRWNKNFETVTGYTGDEIARMSPLDFFGGAEKELLAERIAEVFQEGVSEVEADFVLKDGSRVPYYFNGLRTRMDDKDCLIGVGIDITERRRAEEIIEENERRLSLIFDTVGDVLFLLAVEPEECYRFISVNPTFLAVTGLQVEQVVGKRMEEVLPESAHTMVRSNYEEAIRENKTVRWEEVSPYPTGTLYGEVAITPAWNAAGTCTHLIGSVHDITEIRQAEEKIYILNRELEQRVLERTAQLASANKDLEAFSYSVSHDLRAPLRAVSGFAEIIARRHRASLNEEGQRYLDNIVQASVRMGHIIDDLLSYARLGRSPVRSQPVPLEEILQQVAHDLHASLEEAGGTLELGRLPTVMGDRVLLGRIFTNLLENALTYRRAEVPPFLSVTGHREEHAVLIRVADNGIGIAAEHHVKIFNMFQRLHSEEDYPGTGIGLATVKKSVELLGGRVWVESAVGEGSTFFIQLPGA